MRGDVYGYSLRWYLKILCKSLHVSHGQIMNNFVVFSHPVWGNVAIFHDTALQSDRKMAYPGLILSPSTSWQAGNIPR